MKITVDKVVSTTRKIKVEFPAYSVHDISGSTYDASIYRRIMPNESIAIKESDSDNGTLEYTLQFGKERPEASDYGYGLGKYKSSKAEFKAALKRLKAALAQIDI